jgi:hypothetical protein
MATFETLRMIDLVEKFNAEIEKIYYSKNLSGFQKASSLLQSVYNFHLTCDEDFTPVQEYLKNLYSSFNYAALICNEGIKKKSLDKEDNELLFECLQVMLKCCEVIITKLKSQE